MPDFDPKKMVIDSALVLEDGEWPNFHDATVERVLFWRGDVQPQFDRWIGPQVTVQFGLTALEHPRDVVLRFDDCDTFNIQGLHSGSDLFDLEFALESRGQLNNGEPMTPFVVVRFATRPKDLMVLKCLSVVALAHWPGQ